MSAADAMREAPHAQRPRWRPLLDGALRRRARAAIDSVAMDLVRRPRGYDFGPDQAVSLVDGSAGIGVYFAYLARVEADAADVARDWLGQAVAGSASAQLGVSLHVGFPGVAWAVTHASALLGDEIDDEDWSPVDRLLERALGRLGAGAVGARDLDLSGHGLLFGLAGSMVYALERGNSGRASVRMLVDALARRAERCDTWVSWRYDGAERDGADQPEGVYRDVGVDRGVMGVAMVLARAHSTGHGGDSVLSLVEGALCWVWAQRRADGRLPYRIDRTGPGIYAAGWFKGQLGVAVAMLAVAELIDSVRWRRAACELAEQIAREVSPRDAAMIALNDGAVGIAHLFNRMFQGTGVAIFEEAAVRWYARGLDLRVAGAGIGGFAVPNAIGPSAARQGIAAGAAGIGLALLAATTDVEPAWDSIFAASAGVRT